MGTGPTRSSDTRRGATVIAAESYAVILDPEYVGEYVIPAGITLLAPTNSDLGNGLAPAGDPITLLTAESTPIDTYSHPVDPGNGISREKIDVTGDDVAENWSGSPCGHSPGEPNCAAWETFPLLISEVMANPIVEYTGEYVELYNYGDRALNAKVFLFYDGDSYDVIKAYEGGSVMIPAESYAVLLDSDFAGEYTFPEGTVLLKTDNKTLGNGLSINDPAYILSWDLRTVDSYSFPFNPGNGVSAEKIDLFGDDVLGNWMSSPCGYTPGELNCASGEIELNLVLSEIMAHPLRDKTGEFVELYNAGEQRINCRVLYLTDMDTVDTLKSFKQSSTILEPGEYGLILDRSFRGDYVLPEGVITLTTDDYAIGNRLALNDPIIMLRWDWEPLDTYTYPFDPGLGISVEKVDLEEGDTEKNWAASTCSASPGLPNCVASSPFCDQSSACAVFDYCGPYAVDACHGLDPFFDGSCNEIAFSDLYCPGLDPEERAVLAGLCHESLLECTDADGDEYYLEYGDCDDANPDVFPGNPNGFCDCDDSDGYDGHLHIADEICADSIDNDCDWEIDEECVEVSCGQTLTDDAVLGDDLVCTTTAGTAALTIEAGITLDCAGHTITNFDAGRGMGIFVTADGASIVNCTVEDFDHGIYLYGSSGSTVLDSTAAGNSLYGIRVHGASHRNLLDGNTATGSNRGIFLSGGTADNTLIGNTACDNRSKDIYLESGGGAAAESDENICDTTRQYDDAGTTGCTYACP